MQLLVLCVCMYILDIFKLHIWVNVCVRVHLSVHVWTVFVSLVVEYTILRPTFFLHCVLSGCKETGLGTDSLSFPHKPFSFKDFSL